MEFISNSGVINHRDVLISHIEWATECYLCTGFFDKKGLDIILPSLKQGITERNLKVAVYSNGEKGYTKPSVINKLKKMIGVEHKIIRHKGLRLHSKIYLFVNENDFILVVGSANLTSNGLVHNEEFSTQNEGNTNSAEYSDIKKYFDHLGSLKSA
jgi:HKD family nuclease